MYFSLFSFSLLINILLDFGATNFNNRSISQNPEKISIFFFNIVTLKFILTFIYGVVAFTLATVFGYDKRQMSLLFLLVINQFLSSFILFLRSNISGLQFYTIDSLLSVLDRSLMIVLCSLALWGNLFGRPVNIKDFVSIQTFSYFINIIIIFCILINKAPKLKLRLSLSVTIQILRDCLPFAILVLLMSMYNRMDSVMLERMLSNGKTQAGIYAQSYRILDAFSMFAFLFPSLLLPMFSRILIKKESIVPLMQLSSRIIFVCAIMVAISCSVFASPIIKLLYHENIYYSSEVFSILIISFVPISVNYIFGTLLTANGNLKLLNYMALSALIINWSLNFMLIPHYQALGSAWSCLITQSLISITQVIACYRWVNFKFPQPQYGKYFKFLLLSLISAGLVHFINFPWILKFAGLCVLLGFMGFLSKLLSIKQVLSFVNQQKWDF